MKFLVSCLILLSLAVSSPGDVLILNSYRTFGPDGISYTQKDNVYPGTDDDYRAIGYYSIFTYRGTTFTAGSTYTVKKVRLRLARTGTPTGNVTVKIYDTTSGAPTGAALSSSDPINLNELVGSGTFEDIEFTGINAGLTSGTVYELVVYLNGTANDPDGVRWAAGPAYDATTYYSTDGSSWTQDGGGNYQLKFTTYSSP